MELERRVTLASLGVHRHRHLDRRPDGTGITKVDGAYMARNHHGTLAIPTHEILPLDGVRDRG